MGYDLRKEGAPHNCLDDARAAMKLVLAKLESKVDDVITEANEDVRIGIFQPNHSKAYVVCDMLIE